MQKSIILSRTFLCAESEFLSTGSEYKKAMKLGSVQYKIASTQKYWDMHGKGCPLMLPRDLQESLNTPVNVFRSFDDREVTTEKNSVSVWMAVF